MTATEVSSSSSCDDTGAEVTIRQVSTWAGHQAKRLASGYQIEAGRDLFLLAQTIKLGEEVGELHAEILGRANYHGSAKAGRYSDDSLAGELADVTVCVAILAETMGVDLADAVVKKIATLQARYNAPPL